MRSLKHVAGLMLALALLGGMALAQNDDTPLGDVAREKPAAKAVHSFDDDNFQRTVPPPAPASADAAKPAAKPDPKAEDKPAPADDVKALEKQLADLKKQREATAGQMTRMQAAANNAEGDSRQDLTEAAATYRERLQGEDAQIAATEKKLEAARAAQGSGDAPAAADDSKKPADAKPADTAAAK